MQSSDTHRPEQRSKPQRKDHGKVPALLLWNPVAAVWLSLPLTPVFGALVQMLNWRTLEEKALAQQSLWWGLGGCAILLGNQVVSAFLPGVRVVDSFTVGILLLYLCSWLVLAAGRQPRYVRERYGRHYGRRSWKPVLTCTLAAGVGYVLLGFFLSFLVDVLY